MDDDHAPQRDSFERIYLLTFTGILRQIGLSISWTSAIAIVLIYASILWNFVVHHHPLANEGFILVSIGVWICIAAQAGVALIGIFENRSRWIYFVPLWVAVGIYGLNFLLSIWLKV